MRPRGGALLILTLLIIITGAQGGPPSELCGYTWEAIDTDKNVHYKINVCDSLSDQDCGGTASAICAHDIKTNTYQAVGKASTQSNQNLLVYNTTLPCEGAEHHIQSSINLICGTTLGTPEFVKSTECMHYFEWRTFTACKKDKFKPYKEVPCYVFDEDLKKHDLTRIIKVSGGYLVDDSDTEADLYINICRDIGTDEKTSLCPRGSAACLLKQGKAYNVGRPKDALKSIAKDRLVLSYVTEDTDAQKADFCNGRQPAVTITFICPSARREGTNPKLTASTNCRYEIEWVTESACHQDYLESDNCTLTNEQHDISIDLSPLKHSPVSPYQTRNDDYVYYLNICGGIKTALCPDEKASSCQVKDQKAKIAGQYQNQTLRYSDGDLTLIYPGGEKCSSGFQRMTIINFQCNETAVNDGHGVPEFDNEVDCTYFFTWKTKYACVKDNEETLSCSVTDNKKRYDLSVLTRWGESKDAQNWKVIDINEDEVKETRNSNFFINICHQVLQQGDAIGCEEDAAICAVVSNQKKNLGKFVSPPKVVGDNIQLEYSEGSSCGNNTKIKSKITLMCKPGQLEEPPKLTNADEDGCVFDFEWQTAAACVLSKTEGDNCKVSDPQSEFSFDLSPLTKKDGSYIVTGDSYDFSINVCGNVQEPQCGSNSGACQMTKTKSDHWNLGVSNSRLSYYDGIIQLSYKDGTPYNDDKKTPRSSLITFLCDRSEDIGEPEYQKEDNYTYNFKWHTKYACPVITKECVVMDKERNEQYDLSSLSKSENGDSVNWYAMDTRTDKHKKYYINVCRSIIPVPGCDRFASVCQTEYSKSDIETKETVAIDNLGYANNGLIIESSGRILLEYTDGTECVNGEGHKTNYTTRIHLSCLQGALSSSPRFLSNQDCVVSFIWDTAAACPFTTTIEKTQNCSVKDPVSEFVFNLEPLRNESGYTVSGNGKTFMLNICGSLTFCGEGFGGCESENGKPVRKVHAGSSLEIYSEGGLTLTYRGDISKETGNWDTFTVRFECDEKYYPGELSFQSEDINTAKNVYHSYFKFKTALACPPKHVSCQTTDSAGNEYDLSDLSRDGEPWIAVDAKQSRTFYLNVCKGISSVHGCPGGIIGSCMKEGNTNRNLGYIQSSPQASTVGSLSIVYLNGDKCNDKQNYSTRINFQCDRKMGSPVFEQKDDCEYVFSWRTSEACPVIRSSGDNCQVTDPKNGYVYNLKSLGDKDYNVKAEGYDYYFRVCGAVTAPECKTNAKTGTVSSCQVKGGTSKIAGLLNQNLTFEDGLIKINYTDGETCHKIYKRSTVILFICNRTEGQPVFLRETEECTYMFEWSTPRVCAPLKPIDCSLKDSDGNSYDLSSLSQYEENWEAELITGTTQKYYINVCKPLVPEPGPTPCPKGAAACMVNGLKTISLGELANGPRWGNGLSILEYGHGDFCPDGIKKRSTVIRFVCEENETDGRPRLVSALEDCVYTFVWYTSAACPVKVIAQDKCSVTNPVTGHVFDLTSLSKKDGYLVKDQKRSIKLNICADVTSDCGAGVGVCVTEDGKHISAGKVSGNITYVDQVLFLDYEDGSECRGNIKHKSRFSFVCATESAAGSHPVLRSFDERTCTWFFTWHTSMFCEQKTKCSVWNDTDLIDLSPLIKHVGYYETLASGQDDESDFYINICQPLNQVADAQCPPGAAACMDPVDGPPVDIGRISSPKINEATQNVQIEMDSPTPCTTDRSLNYSSIIIFHCRMGTDLGTPKMTELSGCTYVFEWSTPLVCPDEVITSGCSVTDKKLHYTFNLTSLSEKTYTAFSGNTYKVGICSEASGSKCTGAVCQVSGTNAYSFGNEKSMKMDYQHQDGTVVLQYKNGDPCPPVTEKDEVCVFPFTSKGKTYNTCTSDERQQPWCATSKNYEKDGKWGNCSSSTAMRESTILFKCDEGAKDGSPVILSETSGCSVTFEWRTNVVCLPRRMECKFIHNRKTYDLRMLSSMTGSWNFDHDGSGYYINLCQRVNQGPTGCPESASVCRKSHGGGVEVLGQVHTQSVSVKDDVIYVKYSNGDPCGKDKHLATIIELSCSKTLDAPTFQRFDQDLCEYHITWKTRAACAKTPQEVQMTNGVIHLENGIVVNLTNIYYKSYNASGDLRQVADKHEQYIYKIDLSGESVSPHQKCDRSSICQIKNDNTFFRAIGSSSKVKYYINDDHLDAVFTSDSICGKDKSKNATSTISFHCTAGKGSPEFLHESTDCQYLFSWYTSEVCSLVPEGKGNSNGTSPGQDENYQGLSRRSQAVGAILSLLLVILVVCLAVLLLYKKERRENMMYKITNCCRRSSAVSYKYSKINTEEEADNETEWLMEEVSSNHAKPQHENGHVRSVKPGHFSSLHVDDLDSEDEVLTLPEVRIQSARSKESKKLYNSGSDENLIGIPNGGQDKKMKTRQSQHKKQDNLNIASFHDDSDEDMLNI
ncbi:cation-independent mannose-6-phosphate receptor [Discoglossus pictus]